MRPHRFWRRPIVGFALVALIVAAIAIVPAAVGRGTAGGASDGVLTRLSQAPALRYFATRPDSAPKKLRAPLEALRDRRAAGAVIDQVDDSTLTVSRPPFNDDDLGLPQNEESVMACRSTPSYVLGGTNDYRGLLSELGNFTGWHFSNTGGKSLTNEGLLPAVQIKGMMAPSGGDPVDVFDDDCNAYAGSLAYLPTESFLSQVNGIAVYKSDPATLASCAGGEDPACWPVRKVVAVSPNPAGPGFDPTPEHPAHFFDKEWLDVGRSGSAGRVVWVVYSDFRQTGPGTDTLDFTASLHAVRCDADLSNCTQPILLSTAEDIQFGDVTIGPDGRVYVTWADIVGELPGSGGAPSQPQQFIVRSRVAEPGSKAFGPLHTVQKVPRALPFDGSLHAEDFRVATVPKNAVSIVNGQPRYFVTYEECAKRVLDTVCEEPQVKLTYSDDLGATWSAPQVLSTDPQVAYADDRVDNFFPTISADRVTGQLAIAWYTTRFDPHFHNAYDVDLVTVDPGSVAVTGYRRLPSGDLTRAGGNEAEADPILGGSFIGDYFEVFAHRGRAYVHFNANYRKERLIGQGFKINQQDNFLVPTAMP